MHDGGMAVWSTQQVFDSAMRGGRMPNAVMLICRRLMRHDTHLLHAAAARCCRCYQAQAQ
jgi:hypothetical protein